MKNKEDNGIKKAKTSRFSQRWAINLKCVCVCVCVKRQESKADVGGRTPAEWSGE